MSNNDVTNDNDEAHDVHNVVATVASVEWQPFDSSPKCSVDDLAQQSRRCQRLPAVVPLMTQCSKL